MNEATSKFEFSNFIKTICLSTTIELYPPQINNDMKESLLLNLKKQVENKCNKYGYVNEVLQINEITSNSIPMNRKGTCEFKCIYTLNIIKPIPYTFMVCKIKEIISVMVSSYNGPIKAISDINRINPTNFKFENSTLTYIKTNIESKKMDVGDYVKLLVLADKFRLNDVSIKVVGYIYDIATEDEIKQYYYYDI